ncbi:hypothetical protein [Kamptonema formosum]|uniref:hypothetical protein n=1 Tax=Kamptonema formosum TaxID=331992 RepID=UPI00034B09C0|nr:hypothetical protein [Oscillatoria sp. PCC 10802]
MSEESEVIILAVMCVLLVLHCAIGLAAAQVAKRKGLNFSRWLTWGLIGGTPALVAALLSQEKQQ